MRRPASSVVLLAASLPALLFGLACSAAKDPARPRVALVMKSLANEFFKTMEDGARDHQRAHPTRYELLASGIKDEQDIAGQIRLVEQMVAEGASALVIAPADSKALVSVCRRAQDAGLVVVNIDNRLDPEVVRERGLRAPFVGPDNRQGARRVGEAVAARLTAGDKVAILEGVPGAANAIARKAGFEDAIGAAGLTLAASQSASWETARANQIAAALLREIPDLKALLCANDSMALGAVAALREGARPDVLVAGFDNLAAVRPLLREGRMVATADQHADRLAVYGIEYALGMLETKKSPADRETPVDLVTAESLGSEK
jgi:ribose transport system substrate-binding protein